MEAQKIRIRQAVDSDARGIGRVHIDSWRATYSGIVPAEHLAGLDYDERAARWHRILADRRQNAFVAEAADGRIVGFASGGPERSGDAAYPGELYALYIDESRQRQGLGRRLVAALGGWFLSRGWHSMLTWVLAENPSRGFYDALGGTEGAGRDRLRMERHLTAGDSHRLKELLRRLVSAPSRTLIDLGRPKRYPPGGRASVAARALVRWDDPPTKDIRQQVDWTGRSTACMIRIVDEP